jgi:hypothetical protein
MRKLMLALVILVGCGEDDADDFGVGAQCAVVEDCAEDQTCLPFKGGYCGIVGCAGDLECPIDSACIAHDDGVNYCFRVCADKIDCNANRDLENEANCSGNATFVDPSEGRKACVPPSGS